MTGDVYPAAEMHQWGVVNRIVPAAVLLEQGPRQATFEGR